MISCRENLKEGLTALQTKNYKINWKFSLAAKGRTGNLSKFGSVWCLQQMHSLLLSGLCNGESHWAELKRVCSLTGKRALRELQQQWAWHSCQEKKRLVLQTWYYQMRKQKCAVLFWKSFLLHRFVSCSCISKGSSAWRAFYVVVSTVLRAEFGFESVDSSCINGASVGAPLWGCVYIKGSLT